MRQLCAFLGLVNFYRRFLPNCAHVLLPLTSMLTSVKSGSVTLSEHAITAFKKVKEMLSDTTKLSHIQPNRELCLAVDASEIRIEAVLQQKYESEWKPISFFSRKLTEVEIRQNTFGRELVTTFAAI